MYVIWMEKIAIITKKEITMTDEAQSLPPIVEAAGAVVATIANPSIPVLSEDLLLVHKIASEVKEQLSGKHPGLLDILKALFNIV